MSERQCWEDRNTRQFNISATSRIAFLLNTAGTPWRDVLATSQGNPTTMEFVCKLQLTKPSLRDPPPCSSYNLRKTALRKTAEQSHGIQTSAERMSSKREKQGKKPTDMSTHNTYDTAQVIHNLRGQLRRVPSAYHSVAHITLTPMETLLPL